MCCALHSHIAWDYYYQIKSNLMFLNEQTARTICQTTSEQSPLFCWCAVITYTSHTHSLLQNEYIATEQSKCIYSNREWVCSSVIGSSTCLRRFVFPPMSVGDWQVNGVTQPGKWGRATGRTCPSAWVVLSVNTQWRLDFDGRQGLIDTQTNKLELQTRAAVRGCWLAHSCDVKSSRPKWPRGQNFGVKFGNFVNFSGNYLKSYVVNHYLVLFS